MPGALEAVLEVVTVGVDVADLAARAAAPCRRGAPAAAGRGPGRAGSRRTACPTWSDGPPRMLTITVHGARGAGEPSGRSRTARRWFSNWLVTAPSWVQWPVLWGRIASSLTSTRPSRVSNSSTARIPTTSSSLAIVSATCCACVASPGSRSGAGATTSWQMPSSWVLATTGYAAAWPLGDRATSAASSRRKSTSSSASTWTPVAVAVANASSASWWSRTVHTPRPSYPPRVTLSTHGSPNASTSATDVTTACRGHGTPSAVSRSRITALSWACTSASGPGRTATPASASACRCSVGTCSWSKVTTWAPPVTFRSISRSR